MACLPVSGGCERLWIEPFILHLNELEGSNYAYVKCLDREDRTRPQPEILYCDPVRGNIAIERKLLVWPRDFLQRHQNEHLLMDRLLERVGPGTAHAPFTLSLVCDLVAPRAEILAWSEELSDALISVAERLHEDELAGGQVAGIGWRLCRERRGWRETWEGPDAGLVIELPGEWHGLFESDDEEDSAGLRIEATRLLSSSRKKFEGYAEARRVVLLEPAGNLAWTGLDSLKLILDRADVPSIIGEVWGAALEYVSDTQREWIFEPLRINSGARSPTT